MSNVIHDTFWDQITASGFVKNYAAKIVPMALQYKQDNVMLFFSKDNESAACSWLRLACKQQYSDRMIGVFGVFDCFFELAGAAKDIKQQNVPWQVGLAAYVNG